MDTTRERIRRTAAAARASEELAGGDREARDAAIEAGELEGMSVRDIAACAGMSVSGVQKIIVRRIADRQARLTRTIGL